jgi:hypothetical protein
VTCACFLQCTHAVKRINLYFCLLGALSFFPLGCGDFEAQSPGESLHITGTIVSPITSSSIAEKALELVGEPPSRGWWCTLFRLDTGAFIASTESDADGYVMYSLNPAIFDSCASQQLLSYCTRDDPFAELKAIGESVLCGNAIEGFDLGAHDEETTKSAERRLQECEGGLHCG